ncbi:MAG: hypothetical protein EXQ50_11470 [Acidobacteria bacterium]|nr:hypothetical protein [Acidobacteriota bacterium]
MRLVYGFAIAVALCTPSVIGAQAPAAQPDGAVTVKDGGIFAKGWMGKIDAQEEKAGQILNNSRLAEKAGTLEVRTGPAVTYWNPANKAMGNYTVKATFTESNYMGLNDHPHPYGIVIGGSDLGGADQSFIYCSAYGNGTFIVRGMGPAPFAVSQRKPEPNAAIAKAAAKGSAVKQDIAMSVTADKIECSVNGTVVGSYPKADVVAAGKLKSTDGVYGIRFAHNTEATVTGFSMTKQ